MAIQIPNPGTGNGATGDNEFVLWSKVKDNFSNATHAASKIVGTNDGQIPLAEDTLKAAYSKRPESATIADANNAEVGVRYFLKPSDTGNSPPIASSAYILFSYYVYSNQTILQEATDAVIGDRYIRIRTSNTWSSWSPATKNASTYTATTGTAPNVVVESNGTLKRSTSSEKYKNILGDLSFTDAQYEQALQVKPIVYRSLADGDPDEWHYYSFSAEKLGEYDPALTQWKTHEPDPETGEFVALGKREAEGINLNAIVAFLHATNIKQGKLIDELSARIGVLEDANK